RNTKRLRIVTGSRSRSVQRNAWGSRSPEGSRTRTQRIEAGGRPLEYQTEVAETYSSARVCPPYQSAIVIWVQTVVGSASTAQSFGRRLPFFAGLPGLLGWRSGAGSNRLASRRSRVIRQTWRRTSAINSNAAKLLSATTTTLRSPSQRLLCKIAWRARSVRVLCRLPCASLQPADGASTVRNGRAHRRFAKGTGSITAN